MPSFNTDIDVADLQVVHNEGDPAARLIQIVGLDVPIPTPQGMALGKIGFGTVSSVLDRDLLEKLIEQATDALEALPEEEKASDIVVANNMGQVKQFDNQLKAATGSASK